MFTKVIKTKKTNFLIGGFSNVQPILPLNNIIKSTI